LYRSNRAAAKCGYAIVVACTITSVPIALCNLAELSAGVMAEATLPASMRWIPKGMTVEYLNRAKGTMYAVATPETPLIESTSGYEWPVSVQVKDPAGTDVFRARIMLWVTQRKPQAT
jgi:hypothetical protein